ncbi:glycerol-3-phosphate dehydrogenase [Candidatus Woesearchaeota archaeon CG_4_10_14_0_2_um_filter_33_13]|nr:MAG: glycerol-3-phosphate dehydrogenase [Candidatus Woesearchaeota archaeon CG_4_10_14_0_2_um_filter_33_13]
MNITILGGGSWGTALAMHLAGNKHQIRMWEFFEEQAREMQEERTCKLLPIIKLSKNIFVTSKIEEALTNSELILLVVPSDKVEATIEKAKKWIKDQPVIICSKGFATNVRLLSDVVSKIVSGPVYCLYGPTHAEEVCKGIFSGIVLAGPEEKDEEKDKLKKIIESNNLRVELSDDIIGVQISAALKNILAVFVGVTDGAGLGDNTKAYVITKGLEEIKNVGLAWGAKEETFYGLAGIGDIIVTCTSVHSRNRHVGLEVGKGRKIQEVLREMSMIAEGVITLKEAVKLKDKFNLDLPLITALNDVLFKNRSVKSILRSISC